MRERERETSDFFRLQMVYCVLTIGPYTNRKYKTKLCTQTDQEDIQTAKTQTNKTDINKQTTKNKNNKRKKSGPNSHTVIMRHYGGR